MKIFDQTFDGLQRAMDIHFRRHAVLSSNIANSETPNYRARDVDFAGELSKAFGEVDQTLMKTDPRHLDLASAERDTVIFDQSSTMGSDGNNVDLDVQIGRMSANGRAYETATSLMSQKFKLLRAFTRRGAA